jgi:hypothetical protein
MRDPRSLFTRSYSVRLLYQGSYTLERDRHTYAVTERLVDRLRIDLLDIRHVEESPNGTRVGILSVYEDCRYVSRREHRVFILFGGDISTPPKI